MKLTKALNVYPKSLKGIKNVSLFFTCIINIKEKGYLYITGCSDYQIYDNGKFISYGPSRAAINQYRIDKIELNKGNHTIVIELSGYNCHNYYYLKDTPFIKCEIIENNKVLAYTGKDFKCYLNKFRYQKVARYSFQRMFSESYHFENDIQKIYKGDFSNQKELDLEIQEEKIYLPKNVKDASYKYLKFNKFDEGIYSIDDSLTQFDNRFLRLEFLDIYKLDELEVFPSKYLSSLKYKSQSIKKVDKNYYFSYKLDVIHTGFVKFDITVDEDCELYFIFDEIILDKDISFSRNDCYNIVSYKLKKGRYNHQFFEPYSMIGLKIIVTNGKIKVHNLEFITYENNDTDKCIIEVEDKKISKIFDAARNTFCQNSVDILTDCPGRERAGWLCDGYFTSLAERVFTGANIVEKNFLENYANYQNDGLLDNNVLPMCYPASFNDGNFIPNWMMFYVIELDKYLSINHDLSLKRKSKTNVYKVVDYFKSFENELGLLENLKGWVFIEWSKANDENFIKGVNVPSNILYYYTLLTISKLYNDKPLKEKAIKIKEKILVLAYDGMFFHDNLVRDENNKLILTNNISETCQYYAFFFKVASNTKHQNLLKTLLNDFGPNRDYNTVYPNVYKSNVFIGDYLRLFILLKNKKYRKIEKETIDYFYIMAKKTGTLWEHDSIIASLTHGFASCISYILLQIYLGLVNIDFNKKIIYLTKKHLNKKCSYTIDNITILNDGKNIDIKALGFSIKYVN